jgi:hypothetical protein
MSEINAGAKCFAGRNIVVPAEAGTPFPMRATSVCSNTGGANGIPAFAGMTALGVQVIDALRVGLLSMGPGLRRGDGGPSPVDFE